MEVVRELERPCQLGRGHLRLLTCPGGAGRLQRRLKLIGELLLGRLEHLEAGFDSLSNLPLAEAHGDKRPRIGPFQWALDPLLVGILSN